MKDVVILTGAGQIGMAIARRISMGKKLIIGDKSRANGEAITKIMNEAGFDAVFVECDLSSRESILNLIAEAQKYGEISNLINAAGVSPSQAPIETILKVDLYGTAVLLEEVGKVIQGRRHRRDDFEPVRSPYARARSGDRRTARDYTDRGFARSRSVTARKHP